jgi:hypothetical protein
MHLYASNSSDISTTVNKGGIQISDVVDWFINLPWQKMASWIVVILAATQLKEFLGVRYYRLIWKIEWLHYHISQGLLPSKLGLHSFLCCVA